jgi:aspartate/methionine/tyrosine aminotransferase
MNAALIADLGLGHVRIEEEGFKGPETEYGPADGFAVLREGIAKWEQSSVDEVAVTTGASLGLVATLASLEKPCSILAPRPYYPLYPKVAQILGIDMRFYELNKERQWQPDAQEIRSLIRDDTRAIILNFPGNPTGALPHACMLQALATVVRAFDLLVISDEVYSDFIYGSVSFPDIRTTFGQDSVIRLRSFSKTFGMPGERLGYVIASRERLEPITRAHWTLTMSPPVSAQAIALARLQANPQQRVQRLRRVLAETKTHVEGLLMACTRISFVTPQAGIFFWLEIHDCPVPSRTLASECASQAGVVVVPGCAFGIERPIYLRASFAVSRDEAMSGFARVIDFLRSSGLRAAR